MAANTRIATAAQILCVIAFRNGATTSDDIANSLATNPVVVRRLLKDLAVAGLVGLKPGRDGGVQLRAPPERISLDHIRRAVEPDPAPFALRPGGNPRCPVNAAMPRLLAPVFDDVGAAIASTLGTTTIADLMESIPHARPPA